MPTNAGQSQHVQAQTRSHKKAKYSTLLQQPLQLTYNQHWHRYSLQIVSFASHGQTSHTTTHVIRRKSQSILKTVANFHVTDYLPAASSYMFLILALLDTCHSTLSRLLRLLRLCFLGTLSWQRFPNLSSLPTSSLGILMLPFGLDPVQDSMNCSVKIKDL